jgi:hypothetical protein
LPVDGQTAYFVGAGGKPLAYQSDDASIDTGERPWELQIVDAAKPAALGNRFVLPGDAEKVEGSDIPQADVFQIGLNGVGDQARVLLLFKGRDDDAPLLSALYGPVQAFLVDGQVDHCSPRISNIKSASQWGTGQWVNRLTRH